MKIKTRSKLSAQDIQDEIFRKMPKARKLKLAFEFSTFMLKLNKSARTQIGHYGLSKIAS